MEMKKNLKNAEKISCESCGFVCSKQSNFNKHLLTRKHEKSIIGNKMEIEKDPNQIFQCEKCNKIYKTNSGLWKHYKACNVLNENDKNEKNENDPNKINEQDDMSSDKELINLLIKENADFKNMFQTILFDVVKSNKDIQLQMLDAVKQTNTNNTINNNSHNKTFNLQFFLNEQCKDAMNIMDFVNSVTLQFSDLESVGKLGYVEGISNIMIKKLNEMDVYKRP